MNSPDAVPQVDFTDAVDRQFAFIKRVIELNHQYARSLAEASEVLQLSRQGRPTVKMHRYAVESRPAVHLDWTATDEARVEQYDEFVLIAWSSRLSPVKAFRWLLEEATSKAGIAVDTLAGSYDNPESAEQYVIREHPELIRLVRVEDEDATLIWELIYDGHSHLPHGKDALRKSWPTVGGFLADDRSRPEFVVMVDHVDAGKVVSLIEQTASTNVVQNVQDILKVL